MSSPMLLVPSSQPPAAQASSEMYHAQPAGPGFDSDEPSAAATITLGILPGHDTDFQGRGTR